MTYCLPNVSAPMQSLKRKYVIKFRNIFLRQIFSFNIQYFKLKLFFVTKCLIRIFDHGLRNIRTFTKCKRWKKYIIITSIFVIIFLQFIILLPIICAFEPREGNRKSFVISPGPQPMSIHFPRIFIKSSLNSSIIDDILFFWTLSNSLYILGFSITVSTSV